MDDYIDTLCTEFPYQHKLTNKKESTSAAEHLFKINPNTTKLDQSKAETFHTWVAKSLFVSKHSHLDIILTVAFLCIRVRAPNKDDWKKLICPMHLD